MVFRRKYRRSEHYFSVWCLGNSQKLLTTNQFLVSTTFLIIMIISFFNLRLDFFSIIAKKVNQTRNNAVSLAARLVFASLLCTHYGPLQCFLIYFRKLKEIAVLRPISPDYVIFCDYVWTGKCQVEIKISLQ